MTTPRDCGLDGIVPQFSGDPGQFRVVRRISDAKLENGIIFKELYAGRIVWNKVRMVKDPESGRRVSRANDRSDRTTTMEADHLRIVDQKTWEHA